MDRRSFITGLFGGITAAYAAAKIPVQEVVKTEAERDYNILDHNGERLRRDGFRPIDYLEYGQWFTLEAGPLGKASPIAIEQGRNILESETRKVIAEKMKGLGYNIVHDRYIFKEGFFDGGYGQKPTLGIRILTNYPKEVWYKTDEGKEYLENKSASMYHMFNGQAREASDNLARKGRAQCIV